MAMQGKTSAGDPSPLDVAEAEEAASAIRPSWAVDDDDAFPPLQASGIEPTLPSAGNAPRATAAAAAVFSETLPLPAMSAEAAAAIIGETPSAPGSTTGLNNTAYSAGSTRLGLSAEALGVVAAANAAARAAAPEPIADTKPVPLAPHTLPLLPADPAPAPAAVPIPEPSATIVDLVPPSSLQAAIAPAVEKPSVEKRAAAAPTFTADPFANSAPPPAESDSDLGVVPGKSSKAKLWVGIGAVALVVVGGVITLASPSAEPAPKPASTTATGPAIVSPANDIPPPPDKEDLPAPTPQTAAPVKAAEPPPVAKEPPPAAVKAAEPAPAPKAIEPAPPKPVAAAPAAPVHHAKPAAPPPPPAAPPAAKSPPPKPAGGGIVRDSPF